MKRPSFQFYPGDWQNDAALRMCSVAARGLWIEIMCIMHQGSEYGYLKVNHKPILTSNLARMVGAPLEDVEVWLTELKDAGVYSEDEHGCIYSRRMIRDENLRKIRAAGGKLGGNPALKDNRKVNLMVDDRKTSEDNQNPTPSSSSSSSLLNNPLYPLTDKTDETEKPPLELKAEDPQPKRSAFRKPTLDEVKAEALLIELPADEAEAFFNYFQSNGWKVGRNPMKCWKSALRTWWRTWKRRNETNPSGMSMPDRIAKGQELNRAVRELDTLGKASDHDKDSPQWKRIKFLQPQIERLRAELGVVA